MSEPVFVAFATQKGGAGKSTLTALVASYLYYVQNVEVVAVDCDSTQHTLDVYRKHDLLVTEENPALRRTMHRFYSEFKKEPYEILLTSPSDAVAVAERYCNERVFLGEEEPKVVFFDITGTMNVPEIIKLIASMDYIFVPITTETGDMASSIAFASNVYNGMVATCDTCIKEIHLVWNKVNTREKSNICNVIDKYISTLGISSLDTVLVKSTRFEKDGKETGGNGIFRSTMLPPDKKFLPGSNLEELVSEIRSIIKV